MDDDTKIQFFLRVSLTETPVKLKLVVSELFGKRKIVYYLTVALLMPYEIYWQNGHPKEVYYRHFVYYLVVYYRQVRFQMQLID